MKVVEREKRGWRFMESGRKHSYDIEKKGMCLSVLKIKLIRSMKRIRSLYFIDVSYATSC